LKHFWRKISVIGLVSLVGTNVLAQEQTCPEIVQAALDATDEQCSATTRNEACYGNVNLQATPQTDVDDFTFSTPGDIVAVSAIESFRLSSQVEESGEWGVALMQLQANIPDTLPGQNVTFLLFGDVQITNAVASNTDPVTFEVAAEGDINVRSGPSTNDERISSLSAGDVITAIGRNADNSWLQIQLPDETTGWVSADLVATDGDVSLLNVVDPSQPAPLSPMQAFYFQSGIGDAPCAEAPDSGILVQTPEGVDEIEFTVNDVKIILGSTAYLQAQPSGDMTTSVVEGEATVEAGGASVVVPEGSYVSVPLDADGRASGTPSQPQPYDPAKMALLPIRILPRDITITAPIGGNTTGVNILLTAGEWTWTTGESSSEGCEPGIAETLVTAMATLEPFQLPGDEFSLEILLEAASRSFFSVPNAIFSNPDPNTYVVEYGGGSTNNRYTVRVVDTGHIEGEFDHTFEGCSVTIPFEVTLVGGGIIPTPGAWQATWDPPSISCEIDSPQLSGTLTWDMSFYDSFRLPDDEFSPALLYGTVLAFDMSFSENLTTSSPEPNTYVLDFSAPMGVVHFEVRVTDSDHMVGNYELTNANCIFAFAFEMTRVGD
jgi:hypothetical protein